jgi:phage replication-related protein YjqB (UPF0714/DUF867 family)
MSHLGGPSKKMGANREPCAKFRSLSRAMQNQRDNEPYRSFEELSACHVAGRDYVIETRRGEHRLLVAAWHGGTMERGSDILANAVAGTTFDYYAFKAKIPQDESGSHPLHITSGRFNEPKLLHLAAESERVLSVHCCNTPGRIERIFIGGGAEAELREALIRHLRSYNFNSGPDKLFPGHHHRNPCNLGKSFGIQIEVPQEYMDKIIGSQGQFRELVAALRGFMLELVST